MSRKSGPALGRLMRRFEQGLARDAADVQAGAAQSGVLFHAGDPLAQLGGADGRNIAARSGTDDHQVVEFVVIRCHLRSPGEVCAGSSIRSLMPRKKLTASRPSIIR